MQKSLIVFSLVLMMGFVGCGQNSVDEASDGSESSSTSTEVSVDILPAMYTLQEVAAHGEKNDCWMVIDSKVYDVSGFGDKHPGQDSVYEGCGIDATELFETRPMGSGTPHSEEARNWMEDFYIGELES